MKPIKANRKRTARRSASHAARAKAGPQQAAFFPSKQEAGESSAESAHTRELVRGAGPPERSDAPFFSSFMRGISGRGTVLNSGTRKFFERKLGASFSDVRLHTDNAAAMAAKDIGAKAFAWKNHIVVNPAYLAQGDAAARRLLGHELLHVARHGGDGVLMKSEEGAANKAEGAPEAGMEQEAEKEEDRVMQPESLPDFTTRGKSSVMTVFGKSVTVTGKTERAFDGGVGSTNNLKGSPAKNCDGCDDCYSITGSLVITYTVTTTVTLPDVPDGLTKCQQQRVREVIDGKIAPHEQEHVAAFNTYNGTVTLPISYTGCKDGLAAHVQQMHDDHAATREAAAQAKSDALDPYVVPIDLDCEDK